MAGIDPASAAISLIGSFLSGSSQPQPYQTKYPFTGAADPNHWLGELHDTIAGLLNSEGGELANQPHVSAPGMGAYQPHGTMAQATRGAGGAGMSMPAPAPVGPQRRPAAFAPIPTAATESPLDTTMSHVTGGFQKVFGHAPSSISVSNTNGGSPDHHAANLALLALQGGMPPKQQAGV